MLADAEEDILAFYAFPKALWSAQKHQPALSASTVCSPRLRTGFDRLEVMLAPRR
jgi:hypothetical protein